MTDDQTKLINCLKVLGLTPHKHLRALTSNTACVGVTIQEGQSSKFLPSSYRMDSIFNNYVVYWPTVPWPEDYAEGGQS